MRSSLLLTSWGTSCVFLRFIAFRHPNVTYLHSSSSRFDLFHTVAHGKNWVPAEFEHIGENGVPKPKDRADINNEASSDRFAAAT